MSGFRLPHPNGRLPYDLVAIGGDLAPGTIVQGYRKGLFPMKLPDGELGWWSPMARGIIPLGGLHISRSLRKSARRYECTVNQAFGQVLAGCADPVRPDGWIDRDFIAAYTRLHKLGWVHSVEAWRDGELAGGLYGVAIGGAFFGESMFHRRRDSSKVALVHLLQLLRHGGASLLDVQWVTPHLASLGALPIPRRAYLVRLMLALRRAHLSFELHAG